MSDKRLLRGSKPTLIPLDHLVADAYGKNLFAEWSTVTTIRKPVIAAVSGYAVSAQNLAMIFPLTVLPQLGGGCELAMMCDMILASPTAVFGQPEIDLGVSPGAGGTQRLTKIVGKYRAMELMLTGKKISAKEAEQWGLVNRVVGEGEGEVVKEAIELAKKISGKGRIAVQATKEMVNAGELPQASDACCLDLLCLMAIPQLMNSR